MCNGKILHATQAGFHVFRFVGDIRYPLAPVLERFVDNLFMLDRPEQLVLDLNDARTIDSTNLGLMARIANRMEQRGGPRVTIASDRDDINQLLGSMGFDEVFDFVEHSPTAPFAASEVLVVCEPDRVGMARTILDAHRQLMKLNARNRDLFGEVVAALERDDEAQVRSH
jgi:anti-anti-sigma factor